MSRFGGRTETPGLEIEIEIVCGTIVHPKDRRRTLTETIELLMELTFACSSLIVVSSLLYHDMTTQSSKTATTQQSAHANPGGGRENARHSATIKRARSACLTTEALLQHK